MNRPFQILFVTTLLAAMGGTALADDGPGAPPPPGPVAPPPAAAGGGKTIGVDAAVVLPIASDYSKTATLGIGALGRFEYAVNNMLAITGRVGFIYHLINSDLDGVSLYFIPIYAGAKYKIGTSGVFAFGEVGLTYEGVSVQVGGVSGSSSETKVGVTAGAGYQLGKIQLRGNLYIPSVGDAGDTIAVMASVGYDVAAL